MSSLIGALLRLAGPTEIICQTTVLGQQILLAENHPAGSVAILLAPDDPAGALSQLTHAVPDLKPDITILDNYFWNETTELLLRPHCGFLCVVDDLADRRHCADLLLDQNPNREASAYVDLVPTSCKLLVGANYCLIAEPFRLLRLAGVPSPTARLGLQPVFLSLGGGDPNQDMLRLTRLLLNVTDRPISIATGSHIPDALELAEWAENNPRLMLYLDSNVVAQQMNSASYAVASGGTMTWERATLGLPSLSLVMVDNQVEAAHWLVEHGYQSSFDLRPGWRDEDFVAAFARYEADETTRCMQAAASMGLISGDGAPRTAAEILGTAS